MLDNYDSIRTAGSDLLSIAQKVSALLEPPLSPVSVHALSQVEVLAVPRATFVQLLSEEPAVGYQIFKNLSKRLSLINQMTLDNLYPRDIGDTRN